MQSRIQSLSPSAFHATLQTSETQAQQQLLAELVADLKSRNYHFIAISPASHALVNARADNQLAYNLEGIFGWGRRFAPQLLGEAWFSRLQQAGVIVPEGEYWLSKVAVASMDGCLLLHSAYPANDDNAVRLGPDDYRFYSWVDHYLTLHKPAVRRAVDLGCGTGGISMVLATRLPQAQILGVDGNPLALALASASAAGNGLQYLQWQQGALQSSLQGEFDLIVANMVHLNRPHSLHAKLPLADTQNANTQHDPQVLNTALNPTLAPDPNHEIVEETTQVLAIVQQAIERLAVRGTILLYARVLVRHGRDALRQGVESLLQGSSLVFEYEELDPDIDGDLLESLDFQQVDRIAAVILAIHKPLR